MTDNGRHLAQDFRLRLQRQGRGVADGVSAGAIADFEEKHGVVLPAEMAEFYLHVDGMLDGDLDPENHIRVWRLSQIRPLVEELPEYALTLNRASDVYVFADFLIWSLGYIVLLSSDGSEPSSVLLVGEGEPMLIAPSFESFISMYIRNSSELRPQRLAKIV